MQKKNFTITLIITMLIFIFSYSSIPSLNFVKGQQQQAVCINETIHIPNGTEFPVVLLHGYNEGSSVWSMWEKLLKKDNIPFCTVSFSQTSEDFDKCGSAIDHSKELDSLIKKVKNDSSKNQVNIVAHSKGGLDARVYLDNSHTKDVYKLIMIGTPNAGDPIEDNLNLIDTCLPAADDFKTGALATKAKENTNVDYYTITGKWKPPAPFTIPSYVKLNPYMSWNLFDLSFNPTSIPSNCPQSAWLEFEIRGYSFLTVKGFEDNDGIVPDESATSLPFSKYLGSTDDCHTNLLSEKSFTMSEPYLLGTSR